MFPFLPCPLSLRQVDPKDGQNPYFHAIYLSNARATVNKVLMNGVELVRQQFGFWQHWGQLDGGKIEVSALPWRCLLCLKGHLTCHLPAAASA